MPKYLEKKLQVEARKHHLKGKRRKAYVYGTLRKIAIERRTGKRVIKRRGPGRHAAR